MKVFLISVINSIYRKDVWLGIAKLSNDFTLASASKNKLNIKFYYNFKLQT